VHSLSSVNVQRHILSLCRRSSAPYGLSWREAARGAKPNLAEEGGTVNEPTALVAGPRRPGAQAGARKALPSFAAQRSRAPAWPIWGGVWYCGARSGSAEDIGWWLRRSVFTEAVTESAAGLVLWPHGPQDLGLLRPIGLGFPPQIEVLW